MGQPRACECLGFYSTAWCHPQSLLYPASCHQKSAPFLQGHTVSVSSYRSRDSFQLEKSLSGVRKPSFPRPPCSLEPEVEHTGHDCKLKGTWAAQYGLFPSFLLHICRTNKFLPAVNESATHWEFDVFFTVSLADLGVTGPRACKLQHTGQLASSKIPQLTPYS